MGRQTTNDEQTWEDRATQPLGCWKAEFRNKASSEVSNVVKPMAMFDWGRKKPGLVLLQVHGVGDTHWVYFAFTLHSIDGNVCLWEKKQAWFHIR